MKKHLLLSLIFSLAFLSFEKPLTHKPLRKGKDYALFFAVEQYADSRLERLKNPISDAEKMATVLRDNYGFETEVVKNPSLDAIQRKLEVYRQNFASGKWKTDGQLLIYLTGHGSVEDDVTGYFLPADAQTDRLSSTAIAYSIWRRKIAKFKCQHILVVLDACYSGSFDPDYGTKNGDPLFGSRGNELTEAQKLLSENERYQSRFFFTSTSDDKTTPDQSTFAQKFLEGLQGRFSNDGTLTSDELWFNYLKQARPKPRGGTFEDNQADANFLFVAETPPLAAGGTEGVANAQRELEAWQSAQSQNSVYAYENFLRQYPNSDFKGQAQNQLNTLKRNDEINEWQRIRNSKSVRDFENFKNSYKNSSYNVLADEKIKELTKPDRLPFEPDMVAVQGGTFQMGDVLDDKEYDSEKPVHKVTLSSFQMGKYEVSQAEWVAVMGTNPSNFKGDNLPVEQVSWDDVQEYLKKLNAKTGKKYRLPTEAEWEYAARERGKNIRFGNGKNVADPSEMSFWSGEGGKKPYSIIGEYQEKTAAVNSFSPNASGLYNMSGNVWEWCSDWFSGYSSSAVSDPTGAATGFHRVIRGGSWADAPLRCRVSHLYNSLPTYRNFNLGFRVAFSLQ